MSWDSWGRYPNVDQEAWQIAWACDRIEFPAGRTYLPRGMGRSYGDCCLNDGGVLLCARPLNRLISFDPETGLLRCEAGVSIGEILDFTVPKGWFVPVTPGTKHVSVGGAIANDVHGKNHHVAGTFGRYVPRLGLLRSNGEELICSSDGNPELYSATIGGLGLTGLILWAEIQLKPVNGALIAMDSLKFRNLEEFFEISREADSTHEYTVAWLDTLATGRSFGRGIFMRGRHSKVRAEARKRAPKLAVPIDFPGWVLNPLTVRAFNFLYYNKQLERSVSSNVDYNPFFYPLDSVRDWNRIYGRRGFLQFQCVVPGFEEVREILSIVVESKRASFLAVMKEFGNLPSPGMLSFPRRGVTICLDFPFQGESTLNLMSCLDGVVRRSGGAQYPAKDACMAPESFKQYFPRWQEFGRYVDPAFSSSFWRRVTS